jgi:hypothetical protein
MPTAIRAFLILAVLTLLPLGCGSNRSNPANAEGDPSIVLDAPWRSLNDIIVENGTAFDRAGVDIAPFVKISVPHGSVIRSRPNGSLVVVYVQKHLGYHGHPEKSMSIRDYRKKMGCSVKPEDDVLVFAAYGGWSTIEGGARVQISFKVPEGIDVVERPSEPKIEEPDPSGDPSLKPLDKRLEGRTACWEGPKPCEGWRAIPTVPAPDKEPEGDAP